MQSVPRRAFLAVSPEGCLAWFGRAGGCGAEGMWECLLWERRRLLLLLEGLGGLRTVCDLLGRTVVSGGGREGGGAVSVMGTGLCISRRSARWDHVPGMSVPVGSSLSK